jgi:hypothetical protein
MAVVGTVYGCVCVICLWLVQFMAVCVLYGCGWYSLWLCVCYMAVFGTVYGCVCVIWLWLVQFMVVCVLYGCVCYSIWLIIHYSTGVVHFSLRQVTSYLGKQ